MKLTTLLSLLALGTAVGAGAWLALVAGVWVFIRQLAV